MSDIRILFLDILTDSAELRQKLNEKVHFGEEYHELIRRIIKVQIGALIVADGSSGGFPKMEDFDLLIMGGSAEDPVQGKEKEWMKKVYGFIKTAVDLRKPVFGICGGLQFTVRALGGQIIPNPGGREFGTVGIRLTQQGQKDYLFSNMPPTFLAQSSHKYMAASSLKKGWEMLAASDLCNVQAIAIGENIRLVQFHPELKPTNMKALTRMRRESLEKEFLKGKTFADLIRSIQPAKEAERLVDNFIRHFA